MLVLLASNGESAGWVALVVILVTATVHIAFAIGVWFDATQRQSNAERLWFAVPAFWTLATLIGGVLVAGIYWLMHHSTLTDD